MTNRPGAGDRGFGHTTGLWQRILLGSLCAIFLVPGGNCKPPEETTAVSVSDARSTSSTRSATALPAGQIEGKLLWAADLSKGIVGGGFKANSDWQQQGPDGASRDRKHTMHWPQRIVTIEGRQAIEFTLPEAGLRNELLPNHPTHPNGDDKYFGMSFYLGPDYPLQSKSGWQIIWQLHGAPNTGSPPVALEAAENGLYINGGWGRPGATPAGRYHYEQRLMDLQKERWYDVVVHVRFDDQPGHGVVDVWVDDRPVLTGFVPPCGTNYPGGNSYLKNGIYRGKGMPACVLYQCGHRLATGYGAARPR